MGQAGPLRELVCKGAPARPGNPAASKTLHCSRAAQDEDLAGGRLIDWRGPSGDLAANFAGYVTSQTVNGAPYWQLLSGYAPVAACLAPPPPPPPPPGAPAAPPTPTPAPTILPGAAPAAQIHN